MFEKILFPTDLTRVTNSLLFAVKEFREYGTKELVIVHAIEHDPETLVEAGVDMDNFITKLRSKAEQKLEEIKKELEAYFKVSAIVVPTTNVAETISTVANEVNASLLVFGSKGKKAAIMGSTAENLVRISKVPSLVVRTKPEYGTGYYETLFKNLFNKVLVACFDGCDGKSLKIAKNGREILLLHVAELDAVLESKVEKEKLIHPLVPIPRVTEILSEYWMDAKDKLDKIKNELENEGKNVKIIIRFGSPETEIGKAATSEGASLIIVTAEKLGHMDLVVRNSEAPVLILK
uniref:UspA domain-containing protein n=1 Tax=Archaeoglobus fulgidus TaxID=2234 RepID=A0A7C3RIN6_ARCFL